MANFRMTGESFTRQARDLMISEDPARAWRFCAAGLDSGELGAAEAAARKILDGRSRLIGDGGDMMLVDEDPTDPETASYLAEVRYLYAGRVRVDGRWWRPRAQITDLGDEDNPIGWHRTASDGRRAITDWRRRRFEFYANPGERVFVVLGAYMARWAECPDGPSRYNGTRVDDFIIFEPVDAPPHWWTARNRNPSEALADFLDTGRTLDVDGWSRRYSVDAGASKARAANAPALATFTTPLPDSDEARAMREESARRAMERSGGVADIRAAVIEQANGDMLELRLGDGSTVDVPRAPFVRWALNRTTLAHLAPSWEACSPIGLKVEDDDVYHSDWWIGAWLDPDLAYAGGMLDKNFGEKSPEHRRAKEIIDAAWDKKFEIQAEIGRFTAGVVVDNGPVTGEIGRDVVVLADLHPDRLDAIAKARGVITEAGGAAAHLAQVAIGCGITIMRFAEARETFPPGATVELEPATGKIRVVGRRL